MWLKKRTEKTLFEPPFISFTLSFGVNLAKFRIYFIIFVSELSSAVRFMRTNMNLPATEYNVYEINLRSGKPYITI